MTKAALQEIVVVCGLCKRNEVSVFALSLVDAQRQAVERFGWSYQSAWTGKFVLCPSCTADMAQEEEDRIDVLHLPLTDADLDRLDQEFRDGLSESDRMRDAMPDLEEPDPAPDPPRLDRKAIEQMVAVFVTTVRQRNRRAV